jgi:hypothetical protein
MNNLPSDTLRKDANEKKPSQVKDRPWVSAYRRDKSSYPEKTERSGKYLLFVDVDHVDQVWDKIKKATEDGLLGGRSKCATMLPNPNALDPSEKVICVYTYDVVDEDDRSRIREALRSLGFTQKIHYKTDAATREGRYAVRGDRDISARFE